MSPFVITLFQKCFPFINSGMRIPIREIGFCLVTLLLLFPSGGRCDPKVNAETIMKGITSSFALPFEDLYQKKHSSEWRNLVDGFSGSFSFNHYLKKTQIEERGSDGQQLTEGRSRSTLSATLSYNPISYWYSTVTFHGYLDLGSADIYSPELRADWDPDFTYSFGYDDWHPFTLSLTYSNYGGNRLSPKEGENITNFDEGTLSLGWNYILPEKLEELFVVHETGGVAGRLQFNLTPTFSTMDSDKQEHWKQSLSLTVKYTIYKWWYFTYTLYYYPRSWQKQPWDPDYTYGFGYFDWHPGTVSIQYNNYSGNRYPWGDDDGDGDFKDGILSIRWSWKL